MIFPTQYYLPGIPNTTNLPTVYRRAAKTSLFHCAFNLFLKSCCGNEFLERLSCFMSLSCCCFNDCFDKLFLCHYIYFLLFFQSGRHLGQAPFGGTERQDRTFLKWINKCGKALPLHKTLNLYHTLEFVTDETTTFSLMVRTQQNCYYYFQLLSSQQPASKTTT